MLCGFSHEVYILLLDRSCVGCAVVLLFNGGQLYMSRHVCVCVV